MQNKIIPGILEHGWPEIEGRLIQAKGFTDTLHIDIIDGKFVNNKTFMNPEPFRHYSNDFFLELHMMVEEPINLLQDWANAGFKRFLGHIEHMSSQKEFIAEAKKYGEAGLALDGPTHISELKVPFESFDSMLIYTSNRVGFSGPPMMEDRLDKIRHLRKLTDISIEVDGGVNDKTILKAKEAGANCFVSTSYIFHSENPKERLQQLDGLIS